MRSNSLQWISLIRTSVHCPSSHYTSLHCISLPNIPVQCTLVQNVVLHCTSHSVFHLTVSVLYFTGQFFCSVHGTAIVTWKNGNYSNSDLAIIIIFLFFFFKLCRMLSCAKRVKIWFLGLYDYAWLTVHCSSLNNQCFKVPTTLNSFFAHSWLCSSLQSSPVQCPVLNWIFLIFNTLHLTQFVLAAVHCTSHSLNILLNMCSVQFTSLQCPSLNSYSIQYTVLLYKGHPALNCTACSAL